MFGLPKTTEFNRRIPKQKFYSNLDISASVKRAFVEQVKSIVWKNKIAASTTNLQEGKNVLEIEVFEVKLSTKELNKDLLMQIDKQIPYHILFLLENNGVYQAWIGYKEIIQSGTNSFKVNSYFHTEWLKEDNLPLKLEGLNMDSIYENFVRQVAGNILQSSTISESLKDTIEREANRTKLKVQIEQLEKKAYSERQPKRKFELADKIRKLKKELEVL